MCGLVAVIGNLGIKDEKVFDQLMSVTVLRGEDGAGVFSIKNLKGNVEYHKMGGHVKNLQETRAYSSVNNAYSSRGLIGHCRAKTIGGSSTINSHPFTFKDIIGVHNGTLQNWERDLEPFIGDSIYQHEVDSSALYDAIDTVGPEKVIPSIHGAWALFWYNFKKDEFYVLKNERRPLWYAENKARDCIYYASEWRMLYLILERNNIDLYKNEEGFEFFTVQDDVLHTLKLSSNSPHIKLESEVDLEGNKKPPTYSGGVNYGRTGYQGYHGNNNRRQQSNVVTSFPKKEPEVKEKSNKDKGGEGTGKKSSANTAEENPSTKETGGQSQASTTNSSTASQTRQNSNSSQTRNNGSSTKNCSNSKGSCSKAANDGERVKSDLILCPPFDNPDDGGLDDDLPWSLTNPNTHRRGAVRGPNGVFLSEKEYNKVTQGGCSYCQTDYSFDEAKLGALGDNPWLIEGGFLCLNCNMGTPHIGAHNHRIWSN